MRRVESVISFSCLLVLPRGSSNLSIVFVLPGSRIVRGFGSATIIDEMPLRSTLELGNHIHHIVFFLSISAVVYTQRHAIFLGCRSEPVVHCSPV